MKVLLLFSLAILITCDSLLESTINCPDDKKIKIGEDVCAISTSDATTSYVYVKKKSCGKNKKCIYKDPNYNVNTKGYDFILTCQKKLKLLKIGKKCNYNAECYTGSCSGGKCAAYGTEECSGDNNCGPDKYCGIENGKAKCLAYITQDGNCKNGEKCAPGLKCDKSASSPTCKKLYTLEIGDSSSSGELCKSFAAYKGKCIEVTKVADDCSLTYKDKDGNEQNVKLETDGSNKNDLIETDDNYDEVCKYRYASKDLRDDVIERYNKIKINKLTEKKKENCDYGEYLCDKKYAELISVYKDYTLLLEKKLIKDNGEKNKDKKCEYEFWRSTISSSYVNVYFGFVFALLGLLF